jgi:mannose-6-phosphate isomerase-like protein (cupin superfamily)
MWRTARAGYAGSIYPDEEVCMPQTGRMLLNPATGQRLVVRRTAAQTRGRLLEIDVFYPPGGHRPLDHLHPHQEELFEILAGTLGARLDGRETSLTASDVLVIPAGTPHALWNCGAEEVHAVWHTYPALHTEELLETLCTLGRAGKADRYGWPGLLQAAVLLRAYQRELRLAWPPYVVQRALVALLAPVGASCGRPSRLAYDESAPARLPGPWPRSNLSIQPPDEGSFRV